MSSRRKIHRTREKRVLNKRIGELIELLEISKSFWKKEKVRVEGRGLECKIAQTRFKMTEKVKWGRHIKGHKPSLREQYSVLYDLYLSKKNNEQLLEELKQRIEENKEIENE